MNAQSRVYDFPSFVFVAVSGVDRLLRVAGANTHSGGPGSHQAANLHVDRCAYGHGHIHADRHIHADCFPDPYRHTHTDALCHAHRDTDTDGDLDADPDPHPHPDAHACAANAVTHGDPQTQAAHAGSYGSAQA